jgi:hypothetical protein
VAIAESLSSDTVGQHSLDLAKVCRIYGIFIVQILFRSFQIVVIVGPALLHRELKKFLYKGAKISTRLTAGTRYNLDALGLLVDI